MASAVKAAIWCATHNSYLFNCKEKHGNGREKA